MKKIIVTPAGRKRFLSMLSKYLDFYKSEFDEWHLWCNTDNMEDIEYIYSLEKTYNFIKVIPFPDRDTILRTCHKDGYFNGKLIFPATIPYFISVDTIDENAVYIRLDDDIVFIKKHSIKNLFDFRIKNAENYLIYGNIVNNGAINSIHQKINALPRTFGMVNFDALDPLGLYNGNFTVFVHNNFFNKYENNLLDDYYFEPYYMNDYSLVSIQCISWFGKDYKKFYGKIPKDIHEEAFQSTIMPKKENRKNVIFGDGLFCHYAAEVQRNIVDMSNVLENYNMIANDYLK